MKMPFGKYRGMEIATLPVTYLHWVMANFDQGEIRIEVEKVLKSPSIAHEERSQSLEEQANALLGEKPVSPLRRGYRRPGFRRK